MIIDSHTHISFPAYDKDRDEVFARAKEKGVKMICVGTQIETSKLSIDLAKKYPESIWATVGYHPNHLADDWYHDKKEQINKSPEKFDIVKLKELARDEKVVAIGECGLDYFRMEKDNKRKQKQVFLEQAKLAKELDKALMIHARPSKESDDAYEDILEALDGDFNDIAKICHFYVGSVAMTKKLVEAGFYFTFGGVITFARDYDEQIKMIPLEKILLETDAPYVAPALYRGKRNEPGFIIETAKKMAKIKQKKYDKIAEITSENAKRVFKI